MNHNFKDLTNQQFTDLTVLAFSTVTKRGKATWLCQCRCGNKTVAAGDNLRRGHTRSCGCLVKAANTTHELTHIPEYTVFHSAKARCTNLNNPAFAGYGGRGIEFRFKSITDLIEDIGFRPTNEHSLDRIDNNGHYEFGNVRWATHDVQSFNKRSNRYIEVSGKRLTIVQWAQVLGIEPNRISTRLNTLKWCESCAVTLPLHARCKHRAE
jgi:hypothetical protein